MSRPSLSVEKMKGNAALPSRLVFWAEKKKKLLSVSLSHETLFVIERATKCCLMTPDFPFF